MSSTIVVRLNCFPGLKPRNRSTVTTPAMTPQAPSTMSTVAFAWLLVIAASFTGAAGTATTIRLVMGLLDLSRAFYFSVNLHGAAREGARHGAWFNTAARTNNFLDDADVMSAVNAGLNGAGITANFIPSGNCLTPTDSNVFNNR